VMGLVRVSEVKTEAQAEDLLMAKATQASRGPRVARRRRSCFSQCSGHCLPHRRAISETEVQAPTTSTSSNAIQCYRHCKKWGDNGFMRHLRVLWRPGPAESLTAVNPPIVSYF
jgi:hypothetical protein